MGFVHSERSARAARPSVPGSQPVSLSAQRQPRAPVCTSRCAQRPRACQHSRQPPPALLGKDSRRHGFHNPGNSHCPGGHVLHPRHGHHSNKKQTTFVVSSPPPNRSRTAGRVWLVTFGRRILHFSDRQTPVSQTYTDK